MAAFMVIYLGFSPKQAWKKFNRFQNRIIPYCHAGGNENNFELEVIDCLRAIEIALKNRWYAPEEFDSQEYIRISRLENGDMSWVLPGKIIAMSSPSSHRKNGGLEPRFFVPFFKENGVKTVVRLNERMYSDNEFEDAKIQIADLEFPDGSNPSNSMTMDFINLCEKELSRGKAIAVHCRAGLGRTGTLIGLYLMAKYDVDARAAIAWLRLCRPGSVVGSQ